MSEEHMLATTKTKSTTQNDRDNKVYVYLYQNMCDIFILTFIL